MSRYKPVDLTKIKTYSVKNRKSKVNKSDFAKPHKKGASFKKFMDSLPDILTGKSFKEIVTAIVNAKKKGKPVIVTMGAHVIKCGLSPVIIDAVKNKIVTGIALNGAGSIHDSELALFGFTSEDVFKGMEDGSFGMAKETNIFLNECASRAAMDDTGLGEEVGKKLMEVKAPYNNISILASCFKEDIPATVHVSIGGDINHMHPSCSGEALGKATFHDFKVFASMVKDLGGGGVILNFGSAVVLPVVIEKAITIARNLGHKVSDFTGAHFDFIRHYRSDMNLVQRVKYLGGRGYFVAGHHELMIPLLFAAVKEKI
ncbi:MAG: hypothetical protein ABIH00_12000 [Armatimonadota bacterium]